MKRVVALLLIASVALFAAVAPQSDLKVNAGTPMKKMPTATIKAAPLQIEENIEKRTMDISSAKAPAIPIDSTEVTLIYFENFENGANGWTQFDGTAPDPTGEWHLDDLWGISDSLWWCGDYALGGYNSNWYVALETPEVELTAGDSTLSFKLDLNCEGPGGEPAGYDGWDGGNVQISNDGGETWTVLNPAGVPYNCTSLYGFGYVFNEPAPGWGGVHEGVVEVDLGAYIGDTVSVRFVFCSDGGYDTHDDGNMYGMIVDSINVAGDAMFEGSVDDGLVSYAINAASGAFWNIEDRVDSLPSVTHVLRNYIPGDTTYALNLEDYYESPSITLPDEPATLIYFDFEFLADFGDLDEFPNVEYWRIEFSPDDGQTWRAASNLLDDGSPNYVYSQTIPAWYGFQYAYGEACNITSFAGQTVKFRFYFRSDSDEPIGGGLMIDDFVVYSQPDLPVPTGVAVALNAGNVEVDWDDMDGTYELPREYMATTPEESGAYYGPAVTFFSNDSTPGFGAGMDYSTGGKDLTFTNLDFALYNMNPFGDSVSVALFGVDTSVHVLYWSENFVPDTVDGFQTIDISGEDITWNGDFMVLTMWETSAEFPIWYLNTEKAGPMTLYHPAAGFYTANYTTPMGARGFGEVTYSGLEYNVYRRVVGETTLELLNTTPLATNSFVDETAEALVEYEYTVVCVSDGFEGQAGLGASVFVLPDDHEERKHDDGTSEEIFELAMDTTVVVKLTPTEYPAKLVAMRFNALWAGDVYKVKIYKDEAGMPGDSWLLIEPPVTAIAGWNTFAVPDIMTTTPGRDGVVLRDGESVWVGVKGATPGDFPAWLGADTDSFSGLATMQVPGGGWSSIAAYLRGNPMIRGYFDTDIDTTAVPEIIPAKYELAQNYPNPFNPVTTIRFELKETGMTKLDVFDIAGRHVRTLLNGSVEAGAYDLRFDASALSSGVYFYRLTSGDFTDIKKMSLVK